MYIDKDKGYIIINNISYDVIQKGEKVTIKLYKVFEHLKFVFKAEKKLFEMFKNLM